MESMSTRQVNTPTYETALVQYKFRCIATLIDYSYPLTRRVLSDRQVDLPSGQGTGGKFGVRISGGVVDKTYLLLLRVYPTRATKGAVTKRVGITSLLKVVREGRAHVAFARTMSVAHIVRCLGADGATSCVTIEGLLKPPRTSVVGRNMYLIVALSIFMGVFNRPPRQPAYSRLSSEVREAIKQRESWTQGSSWLTSFQKAAELQASFKYFSGCRACNHMVLCDPLPPYSLSVVEDARVDEFHRQQTRSLASVLVNSSPIRVALALSNMPMLAMRRALSGAGSSTPSEEGFVSGFSLFDVQQNPLQQKCSSESGASCGETDHSGMLLVHDIACNLWQRVNSFVEQQRKAVRLASKRQSRSAAVEEGRTQKNRP
ncbi:unnamed protein product [Toxocara canis]|uniref:OB_NTP_bind domain-containing protein n=1 Tax=Toxocara canis TaxID=6265 RepID=A0A183ULF3_TOXCA|nr:unnamed protein product [Toxocara canis]